MDPNKLKTMASKLQPPKPEGAVQDRTISTPKPPNEVPPDKLTCKTCNKTFTNKRDKLIECERCVSWICLGCSGLTKDEYKICNREDSKIHWYCIECNAQAVAAVKTDNLIEEKCKQYFESFKTEMKAHLEESLEPVKEDLATFKTVQQDKNEELATAIQEQRTRTVSDSVKEMQEREERRCNIILFNVPESKAVEPEDRKAEDQGAVNELCDALSINIEIDNPIRLGKKTERPRPLRFTTDNTRQVSEMLAASRRIPDLESTTLSNVVVKRDLTPLEREEHKLLLDQRRLRIEESQQKGEDARWVIRKGRVVNIARRPRNQGGQGAGDN